MLALASYVYRDGLFALSSTVSAGIKSNIVDTGYATYLGNRSYLNTVAYLGIPYAEPPVGDRRLRAPLPLNTTRVASESKGVVINATQYPNFCIQGTTGSDCKFLRVYLRYKHTY
jgi:carboxylesterase type B